MKKVLLLLMAMMMSFSALCFASNGSDLDAEAKIVDQFLTGKDYNKVVGHMDPEWSKNFSEEQYKNMFASMEKDMGKLKEKDLRVFQVIKDGNVLRYAAKYEKAPLMEIIAVFKNVNGKISMMQFMVLDPNEQTNQQQGQTSAPAAK